MNHEQARAGAGASAGEDEAEALPCWVGLLAASLALMTAHATPQPTARIDAAALRRLIARKLVSNLFFLGHHPHAPPGLRQVAANMHVLWVPLAQEEPAEARPAAPADAAPRLH